MNPKQDQLRAEYAGRMNRAMDYIQGHLCESLSLEAVAKTAGFSKFHFHRIFSSFHGETLNQFVKRLRVERAAGQLAANRAKSVTEIALDCGFSSSAAFARAFKDVFGMSASDWRNETSNDRNGGQSKRNICKTKSNSQKEYVLSMKEDGWMSAIPTWRIEMKTDNENELNAVIEVKDMPDYSVVYVRHVGPYQGDSALFGRLIGQLCSFAGPRGLLTPDSRMLMVYHDDPGITEDDKLRVDVCLTVSRDVEVTGEIGKTVIPGGRFAVGHFEINQSQFGAAWDAVMAGFMPSSGFQPDDRPCYEMCLNDPQTHPEQKHIVDICVPVKPL